MEKKHLHSVETLNHFRCGKCNHWWTIADASKVKKIWHCPWCGYTAGLKRVKNKI